MSVVSADTTAPVNAAEPSRKGSSLVRGVGYGLAAVLIWGGYLAMARAGVSAGLTTSEFALIRLGTAGVVMLPWLLLNSPGTMAGVGWMRSLALAALVGPLFILLSVGGYHYAPLAHGAVLQPSTAVIGTALLSVLILNDRPSATRIAGLLTIIAGIAVISGPGLLTGSALTPLGDAMFMGGGLLWAVFTLLLGRWRIGGVSATAAVSVLSAAIVIPLFAAFVGFAHLATLPMELLVAQVLVQGVLSGVGATIFFGRAVEAIGAARAAMFPALVPAAAIVLGIPIAGEWPTSTQVAGLLLVSCGLVIALGLVRWPTPGARQAGSGVIAPRGVNGADRDV